LVKISHHNDLVIVSACSPSILRFFPKKERYMVIFKQVQAVVLCLAVSAVAPTNAVSSANPAEPQNQESFQAAPMTGSSAPSQELQQLVAPIALYPDALVGQVLAGATYPTQIVEAERWLQQNKNLQGDQFVAAVDKQPWDPSIKALSQFPQVVSNMNQNLSWTSSLGDAYFNDPNGVMNAIQILRKDAQNAGNLKSTPEQSVTTENQTIIIQPTNPEVVYVPTYSPEVVYGTPIEAYPGYSGWDVAGASAVSFGVGMAVGAAFNNNWGWRGWGTDWHGGGVMYNHNRYVSRSNTFVNRNAYYNQANRRTNVNANLANRSNQPINQYNRPTNRPDSAINQNRPTQRPSSTFDQANRLNRQPQNLSESRGFGNADRSSTGARSGAFGGYSQGGSARMNSARGQSSFSGGGGVSRGGGGGGASRRGGGGRGGGRR